MSGHLNLFPLKLHNKLELNFLVSVHTKYSPGYFHIYAFIKNCKKVRLISRCAIMNRAVMNCAVMNCAVMNCAVMKCAVMNCEVMNCAVMNCAVMKCAVMNCAVMNFRVP
jgi:hypothetical protein